MKKRLIAIILAMFTIVSISLNITASAATTNNISAENKIILYEGETIVGDTIVGAPIVSDVNSPAESNSNSRASCPNYAESKEILQLYYKAHIQFRANYLTKSGDGSGLKPNRNVKQGWIDYRRSDVSVIGGTKYTTVAPNKSDSTIREQNASCWDNLINWGDEATTYFYRGWYYFA